MKHTPNNYTTIIFDLTGVIFKVNKLHMCKKLGILRTFWYTLTHLKNPVDVYLAMLNALHTLRPAPGMPHMRLGSIMFPSYVTDYFLGKKNGAQTAQELYAGIETLDAQHFFSSRQERTLMEHIVKKTFIQDAQSNGFVPIPKNVSLLQKLRGSYRLLLLSNFDQETFAQLYRQYDYIFHLFDEIIISGQVGLLKPYKQIYQHVLNTYALCPEETIFIDDQEENLLEPKKMGFKTILYKKHKQLRIELQKSINVQI